ncbi:peptide methionine sulfoxide reductase [Crucibulum laeve]|uniref:peptide-methionine (S)-S-oxide reductase n=1 Tax=Crucibulum laeve TaxID=68775 RepID=A0A5C3LUC9_9AGAR|nr:peptide methionine sulfoxide reductase [Crucibulum laeve]
MLTHMKAILNMTPPVVDPAMYQTTLTSSAKHLEIVIFAAGCFWGLKQISLKHFPPSKNKGILKILVGYMGRNALFLNPNYGSISGGATDHTEALKIKFDPGLVTYKELIEFFYCVHDTTTKNSQGNNFGTQYRSAIFTLNATQRAAAQSVTAHVQARRFAPRKREIVTIICDVGSWCDAEEHHQLYLFKNSNGCECPTHRLHW